MKRIASFLVGFLLMFALSISAFASGGALSVSASSGEVKRGDTVTFTVSLSGDVTAKSMALTPSYDSSVFEMVSGQWLISGAVLSNFDGTNAAMAFAEETAVSGSVFQFTLKAKENAAVGSSTVSVVPVVKNGTDTIAVSSGSGSATVVCREHTYGEYTSVDNGMHQRVCTTCGAVDSTAHIWDGGTITKAATCKEAGEKVYTCTTCGATKTEALPKNENHSFSSWSVIKVATCTAAGEKTRVCSVCGKKETQSIAMTSHSFGSWQITKEATCTAAGEKTRTCTICGKKETASIAQLEHQFGDWTVTREATCTAAGEKTRACTICGKKETASIAQLEHQFGNWSVTKEATCTESGEEIRRCSLCGITENRQTEALGHEFSDPEIVREATISTPGLMEGTCIRCGETTQQLIPCSAIDEATGIVFQAEEGVFAESTEITVNEIRPGSQEFEAVQDALSSVTNDFTAYQIAAVCGDETVQPNGTVKVMFPIPDGYGENVALYAIAESGSIEMISGSISADGATLEVELDCLGQFALCRTNVVLDNEEEKAEEEPPVEEETIEAGQEENQPVEEEEVHPEEDGIQTEVEPQKGISPVVWIVVALVLLAVAAGIYFFIAKKKKRGEDEK